VSKGVREILQKEIWSKRTTKRIAVGISLVVLVVFVGEVFYDGWLNPMERRTAVQIVDRASEIRYAGKDDLEQKVSEAKLLVPLAKHRVWTLRDMVVETLAESQISSAELFRRLELKMYPITPDREESINRMRQMVCSLYPPGDKALRDALSSRSGF